MPSQIMCLKLNGEYVIRSYDTYVCLWNKLNQITCYLLFFCQSICSGLAFKPLSPSDSTDLSEARFSFPDSQNGYEDTYIRKSQITC